jgi:transaldolase
MELIKTNVTILKVHTIETEIIDASIRTPMHDTGSAVAGAHIATVPLKIIKQIIKHPLTDTEIEKIFHRPE